MPKRQRTDSSTPETKTTLSPREMLRMLRAATPPIFQGLPPAVSSPGCIINLRRALTAGFGNNTIPRAYKTRIQQHPTQQGVELPEYVFFDDVKSTPQQLEDLWELVSDLQQEDAECAEYLQDENGWCSGIIDRLLRKAVFRSQLIQVKSVQSQSLKPELLSTLPSQVEANHKIDYAFSLSVRDPDVWAELQALSERLPAIRLGITNDIHLQDIPLFLGLEAKRTDGDEDEALLQLSVWFAAYFQKFSELETVLGPIPQLPGLGIVVHGHNWSCFLAHKSGGRIYVEELGDVKSSTGTFRGIFQVMNLMTRIATYLETEYWPLYRNHILIPLLRLNPTVPPNPCIGDREVRDDDGIHRGPARRPVPVPGLV